MRTGIECHGHGIMRGWRITAIWRCGIGEGAAIRERGMRGAV